jgi:hypothetical protein
MRRALVAIAIIGLAACGKNTEKAVRQPDAGFVPVPTSALAQELGADDAGRGMYRWFDDGPLCGSAPRVDRKKELGTGAPETFGPFGFFETEKPPSEGPATPANGAMRLALSGPKSVEAGTPFKLSLVLTNTGGAPFRYGVAVDGSFEHWRSPFVDLYARDEASGRTYRWTYGKGYGRCGNVNSRRADDYILLAPGEKKTDPFGEWSHNALGGVMTVRGRYTLFIVYAECPGMERGSMLDTDDKPPEGLFDGTIASTALAVEVR